jgi:hypothetical protein
MGAPTTGGDGVAACSFIGGVDGSTWNIRTVIPTGGSNKIPFSSRQETFPATKRYNAEYLEWDTFGVGTGKIAATGFVVAEDVTRARHGSLPRARRGSPDPAAPPDRRSPPGVSGPAGFGETSGPSDSGVRRPAPSAAEAPPRPSISLSAGLPRRLRALVPLGNID